MSNPVVLITGALTGIGRATAIAFAKEGAGVASAPKRRSSVPMCAARTMCAV
jgi:NAD(P)-dependent dehydrogenase (short-subunit alcohol dehydrogenase family)